MNLAGMVREASEQCDRETYIDVCNYIYVDDSPKDAAVCESGSNLELLQSIRVGVVVRK